MYLYTQTLCHTLLKKNALIEKYEQNLFKLFQKIFYKIKHLGNC